VHPHDEIVMSVHISREIALGWLARLLDLVPSPP
jgi:hypothetical protein